MRSPSRLTSLHGNLKAPNCFRPRAEARIPSCKSPAFKLCALILVFAGSLAWAQNEADLSGAVHDSSGAILPQATVKLTSRDQGTVRTVQTNDAGVYQFTFLLPGTYDLEASAAGFKTLLRPGLVLAAAQNLRIDLTLEVGNVSENVTVSANVENVNTESAEVGAVVANTNVVEMPLNGRVFFSLPTLVPNVLPPAQNSGLGYRGGFNVAGNCEGCNNFTLNGMDNNDSEKAVPNFRPSIDAIQEFNILTGIAPAQYGFATGGQIIMTTKSGTNQFHGVVFDFLRNQAVIAARNFFALPGPLPAFKRNQFGATLGGPIIKDKTFFFFSYEGLRLSQAVTSIDTVPTPAIEAGNFAATGKAIKDPTTGVAFSGDVIPQSRISPIGAALAQFWPAPTSPTPSGLPASNYVFAETRTEVYNEYSLKLDHSLSSKDSGFLTANYYLDHSFEPQVNACPSGFIPGFGCYLEQRSEVYGASETHIFSPSMVNEIRSAFSIVMQPAIPQDSYFNFWGTYGISPVVSSIPTLPHFGAPQTSVTGFTSLPSEAGFERKNPQWQFSDTFSWTRGKHTIKIGGNLMHYAANIANVGSSTGSVSFSNTSAGPTSGYGFADLLLGLPSSTASQPYANRIYPIQDNIAGYIQDDYKISSSLTLNIGLRWEINTVPLDRGNHLVNFDPVKGVAAVQGTTPWLTFVPDGYGEHVLANDWYDYAPRFGFAWQPFRDGKTVVRGGFGTFQQYPDSYNSNISNVLSLSPINYSYVSSIAQPISLSNPFPSTNAVTSSNPAGATFQYKNARTYEWSLGVQRQLTKDMLFEITYFGLSASHLSISQNINQPAPGPGTPAQVNARRPYPLYGNISFGEWDGNSHFDSLALKLQKRYGYGLSFLTSFTYGKSIDDLGGATNAFNLQTARGLSSFDVRDRLVLSPVYELPFGKGKPFLSNGVAAMIAGGWQFSTLFQWQTGTPLTATLSGNYSNSGGTTDRPDLISDPNSNAPHTPQEWFNTAAFALRPANGAAGATYSFGDEGRGVITGPGLVNMDISLVRIFQIRERIKLEFRAEVFDTLNHPNFSFPALQADTSSFGQITGALDPRESQFALKIVY